MSEQVVSLQLVYKVLIKYCHHPYLSVPDLVYSASKAKIAVERSWWRVRRMKQGSWVWTYTRTFHKFKPLQLRPAMLHTHQLHSFLIPLVRRKFHLENIFPRVAALWNRKSGCFSDLYEFNLFKSSVNCYLFYIFT